MGTDMKRDWYASRAGDGQDRSYVPPMPLWTGILRIFQMVKFPVQPRQGVKLATRDGKRGSLALQVLALLLLILTAYAGSRLGNGVSCGLRV